MPLILPGNVGSATAATEVVSNSARFNAGSSDYLSKAFGTGNRKTWTFSTWIKLGGVSNGDNYRIFSSYTDSSTSFYIGFDSNRYYIYGENGNTVFAEYIGTSKLRDPSAWYHLVFAFDTTQSTAGNRLKIYKNNVLETLTVDHAVGQDEELELNRNGKTHYIGQEGSNGGYLSGYLAETVFIDGAALAPTSFGEFDSDSGIWKPIDVSGLTFGTNGFYLDYEDSSALGNDKAGSNNFAVNNLTAVDQSLDTCINNFTTLNRLHKDNLTLSEGNLTGSNSSSSVWNRASGTIAVTSGKWYAEFKMTTQEASQVGVIEINRASLSTTDQPRTDVSCYAYKDNGQKGNNNSDSSYGATYTDGDIIAIALDLDNHKIYFSKNGTFQNSGDPTTGATGTGSAFDLSTAYTYTFIAAVYDSSGNGKIESNFGGTQSFTVSSGNTDGNGYGNFEYAVPSGYYSLNTKNLAEYG